MSTAAVTNVQVAEAIGMTHSGVSRIRSGDRLPSIERMAVIADVLGWSMDDQTKARLSGSYAAQFERVLCDKYGKATDDFSVPSPAAGASAR